MKTTKYFLGIFAAAFITVNALIFVITGVCQKEAFQYAGWWLSLSLIEVVFILILVMRLMNPDNERKQSPFLPLLLPICAVVFLGGLIMIFFRKIYFLIPLLILITFSGFATIGLIFGALHKENVANVPQKIVDITDMAGLIAFLHELENHSDNRVKAVAETLLELAEVNVTPSNEVASLEKSIFERACFMKKDLLANNLTNLLFQAGEVQKLLQKRSVL